MAKTKKQKTIAERLEFTIEPELARVRQMILNKKSEINNEANSRGALYSGDPIAQQSKIIPELLEAELMKIAKNYPISHKDVKKMHDFIEEEGVKIGNNSEYTKAKYIAPVLSALKQRITNQYVREKKSRRNDRIKYWITFMVTTLISVGALVVSIISLLTSMGK